MLWVVPTAARPWRSPFLLVLIGFLVVAEIVLAYRGGPVAILDGLRLVPHLGSFEDVVVVWGLMIGLPACGVVGFLTGKLTKVGVDDFGLTLKYRAGTIRVPWEEVRPPRQGFRPGRDPVVIRCGWSLAASLAGLWPERLVRLDRDSLRTVLSHPSARRSRLGASYWLDLGLTPP